MGKYDRICSAVTMSLGILGGAAGSLAAELDCPPRSCSPVVNESGGKDCPNTHNMMVVGNGAVFLSHLPMFGKLNKRSVPRKCDRSSNAKPQPEHRLKRHNG